MKQRTDTELISLVRQSDAKAFNELHHRFWHSLYAIAYKKIGDPDETSDLLQELFIELWEKRESLLFNNAVNNWLRNRLWFKIALYFRNKGTKEKHRLDFFNFIRHDVESAISVDISGLEEKETFYEEILATLNSSIDTMPERMKEIFLMSKSGNYTVKEIAEKMNISPKTVKSQLERATIRLKKVAEQHHPTAMELLLMLWLINC